MKHITLNHDQRLTFSLCTDLYVVTHEDLTNNIVNTPQDVVLDQLKIGDKISTVDIFVQVVKNFAGLTTCTLALDAGAGPSAATANLLAAGVEHYSATGVTTGMITANVPLLAHFVGGAAEGLASANAGEVLIWMRISRVKDRSSLQY